MSDCVTVSDATILYCSDIECTENTCYAAVTTVGGGGGGATTHEHSNQQLEDSTSSPNEHHDYDVPQVIANRPAILTVTGTSIHHAPVTHIL